MIEIKNLVKKFSGTLVLDKVNLNLKRGESLAIIGPSGCGKSTMLRLIIGLFPPTSGEIKIKGININGIDEEGMTKLRETIGMVFQSSALFDSLTVGENVAFGLLERIKLSESKLKKVVAEKLEMVGLEGTEELMPAELSGGMQKRVSLARALATNPEIILYDEPTTGLDPVTSTAIEDLIKSVHRRLKTSSIVVTHQLSTVYRVAQRIVMLDKGKIIESGTPEETQRTKDPAIRRFITGGLENH
ncbi:ABC transporter ATP-binding protein [Candidatus Margulisiibacteriota bacterium]